MPATRTRQRGHDHHRRELRERLHADNPLSIANRESLVRTAILPSRETSNPPARCHQLELLDAIADLLEAIRVQRQRVVRAGEH